MNFFKTLKNGILNENPTFVQVIGMCPTLAVTTSSINGIGMGLSTMFVLTLSNLMISLIRKIIPESVRIPAYVVVISVLSTIVELLLKAYFPSINKALGIYIPLIVVNCIILARAESFASKNNPLLAVADGIGMGLGFTVALFLMGTVRELLGAGSILGLSILPEAFPKTIIMILAPGAFFTLAFLMIIINVLRAKKE